MEISSPYNFEIHSEVSKGIYVLDILEISSQFQKNVTTPFGIMPIGHYTKWPLYEMVLMPNGIMRNGVMPNDIMPNGVELQKQLNLTFPKEISSVISSPILPEFFSSAFHKGNLFAISSTNQSEFLRKNHSKFVDLFCTFFWIILEKNTSDNFIDSFFENFSALLTFLLEILQQLLWEFFFSLLWNLFFHS